MNTHRTNQFVDFQQDVFAPRNSARTAFGYGARTGLALVQLLTWRSEILTYSGFNEASEFWFAPKFTDFQRDI